MAPQPLLYTYGNEAALDQIEIVLNLHHLNQICRKNCGKLSLRGRRGRNFKSEFLFNFIQFVLKSAVIGLKIRQLHFSEKWLLQHFWGNLWPFFMFYSISDGTIKIQNYCKVIAEF
jgi:hypothetical protein